MKNKEIIDNLKVLGILRANQLKKKDLSFWYLKIFKENLNDQEQKILINEAKEELDKYNKDQLIEVLDNKYSSREDKKDTKSKSLNNTDKEKYNRAESLVSLGLEFYELKEYEKAKKCFTNVIESTSFKTFNDYEKSNVYSYRGMVLNQIGESTEGFKDHTKSIELSPNDSLCFYKRALCSYDCQEWNNTIDDVTTAINLNKKDLDYYYLRALAKYALEKYSDAITDLEIALKNNPNHKLCQDLKTEIIDFQKKKEDEEFNQGLKGCFAIFYFIFFGFLTLLLPPIGAIFILLGIWIFSQDE